MRITDGVPHVDEVRELIIEYTKRLNRDLDFQHIDVELDNPANKYAPPRGRLLIALDDDDNAIGCVAYQRLSDERCEMKRLYVRPEYRGLKAGRKLATAIIELATQDGFSEMVLDTIEPLQAAIHLYHSLGFSECAPYYENPMNDVIYMSKNLT